MGGIFFDDAAEPDFETCFAMTQSVGEHLLPAYEPIVVARAPMRSTVTANVLRHGTGALNIAAGRIGTTGGRSVHAEGGEAARGGDSTNAYGNGLNGSASAPLVPGLGRWPANVVLRHTEHCECVGTVRVRAAAGRRGGDPEGNGIYEGTFPRGDMRDVGYGDEDGFEEIEAWECAPGCPVARLDAQSGPTGQRGALTGEEPSSKTGVVYGNFAGRGPTTPCGDTGGAARFLYCAKASTAERNAGLTGLPLDGERLTVTPTSTLQRGRGRRGEPEVNPVPRPRANTHPTVKPIEFMRWLLRLTAREGALVLDPFGGSGTTVCAGALERINVIAIENDPESAAIARARAEWWAAQPPHTPVEVILQGEARRQTVAALGQDALFA